MRPPLPVRELGAFIKRPPPPSRIRLIEIAEQAPATVERRGEHCDRCEATVYEARDDIHFCDQILCRFRAIERRKKK
jgi:hypothetical protein